MILESPPIPSSTASARAIMGALLFTLMSPSHQGVAADALSAVTGLTTSVTGMWGTSMTAGLTWVMGAPQMLQGKRKGRVGTGVPKNHSCWPHCGCFRLPVALDEAVAWSSSRGLCLLGCYQVLWGAGPATAEGTLFTGTAASAGQAGFQCLHRGCCRGGEVVPASQTLTFSWNW